MGGKFLSQVFFNVKEKLSGESPQMISKPESRTGIIACR
jgi:hypothetical protein